jgi:hypothetical protein
MDGPERVRKFHQTSYVQDEIAICCFNRLNYKILCQAFS